MRLAKDQKAFLAHHDIPLSMTFDATGMSKGLYRAVMSCEGLLVAYGVTPCKSLGHSLRTRDGHCIQCSPAAIAFLKRWDSDGYVYVAESVSQRLCKVGFSQHPHRRIDQLNAARYANGADWTLEEMVESRRGGYIESQVHQHLVGHRKKAFYEAQGRIIECYEVFSCSAGYAGRVLTRVMKDTGN
jgi:hypothetical protein